MISSKQMLNQTLSPGSARTGNACATCGSSKRKQGADKALEKASLLWQCRKFLKWVSGSQLQVFTSQLSKRGQRNGC